MIKKNRVVSEPAQPIGHNVLELDLTVSQVQLNLWHLKKKTTKKKYLVFFFKNYCCPSSTQSLASEMQNKHHLYASMLNYMLCKQCNTPFIMTLEG